MSHPERREEGGDDESHPSTMRECMRRHHVVSQRTQEGAATERYSYNVVLHPRITLGVKSLFTDSELRPEELDVRHLPR
jgi:hypothetical protein